jgi:pimeloyl-CoA synthetase
VTRCGDMPTSVRGETASERGKGGDNVDWADVNLTRLKNKENSHSRVNWNKWMMKI